MVYIDPMTVEKSGNNLPKDPNDTDLVEPILFLNKGKQLPALDILHDEIPLHTVSVWNHDVSMASTL
jgi:hypothetical protein